MGRPLFLDIIDKPWTTFFICFCSGIWTYIQRQSLGYSDLGISYDAVVKDGQYWRIITATFSHISFVHLLFNMTSLWSLGVIEAEGLTGVGWSNYLKYTLILVVVPGLLVLAAYHVLIHKFRFEHYRRVTALGYSCVVFGWMTILAQRVPASSIKLFGVLSLPVRYAPFESLIFTSLLVPQASFIGHFAGIIVGYAIAFGLFSGLSSYWAFCLAGWLGLGFVISLKQTHSQSISCVEIEQLTDESLPAVHVGNVSTNVPGGQTHGLPPV